MRAIVQLWLLHIPKQTSELNLEYTRNIESKLSTDYYLGFDVMEVLLRFWDIL